MAVVRSFVSLLFQHSSLYLIRFFFKLLLRSFRIHPTLYGISFSVQEIHSVLGGNRHLLNSPLATSSLNGEEGEVSE